MPLERSSAGLLAAVLVLAACASSSEDELRRTEAGPLPPVGSTTLLSDSGKRLVGRDAGAAPGLELDYASSVLVQTSGRPDERSTGSSTVRHRLERIDGIEVLVRETSDHNAGTTSSVAVALGANDIVYERARPHGEWTPTVPADLPVGRAWTVSLVEDELSVSVDLVFTVRSRTASAPDGRDGLIHLQGQVLRWSEDHDWVDVQHFDTVIDQYIVPGLGIWWLQSESVIDASSIVGGTLPERIQVDLQAMPASSG